jgi:hypothetical protein
LAAGLLVLAAAIPVTAAPGDVPPVGYWEIDCPNMEPFTVGPVGIPGWEVDVKGEPPIHFRQGDIYEMTGGVLGAEPVFSAVPPAGLADKLDLGPCYMHLAGGPFDGWDIVVPNAWYKLQGKP